MRVQQKTSLGENSSSSLLNEIMLNFINSDTNSLEINKEVARVPSNKKVNEDFNTFERDALLILSF